MGCILGSTKTLGRLWWKETRVVSLTPFCIQAMESLILNGGRDRRIALSPSLACLALVRVPWLARCSIPSRWRMRRVGVEGDTVPLALRLRAPFRYSHRLLHTTDGSPRSIRPLSDNLAQYTQDPRPDTRTRMPDDMLRLQTYYMSFLLACILISCEYETYVLSKYF